jgi:hypothetical protein
VMMLSPAILAKRALFLARAFLRHSFRHNDFLYW